MVLNSAVSVEQRSDAGSTHVVYPLGNAPAVMCHRRTDGCTCLRQVHLDEITVIVGALGSITLTLILPPLLHNTVRKPGRLRRVGHWAMSAFWTVILVSHSRSTSVYVLKVLQKSLRMILIVDFWGSGRLTSQIAADL
jgi:hypothetical protein